MGVKQQSDKNAGRAFEMLNGRRTALKQNSDSRALVGCSKYYSIGGGDAALILKIGAFKAATDRADLVDLRASFFYLIGAIRRQIRCAW